MTKIHLIILLTPKKNVEDGLKKWKKLLNLTSKEARKIKLNEETLRQIKKRIRKNKKLVLRNKTLNKVMKIKTI